MIIVSYGGGTNSTAMLIGMAERGVVPELILFADTGGERPDTYCYVREFSRWLVDHGMPEIITVKKGGIQETLEEECLRLATVPPLAFGFKTCSQKYKVQPQDKYLNNYAPARELWKSGGQITKAIGYDMDEPHRGAKDYDIKKYNVTYPLREWGWGRKECIDAIENAGLRSPGKSSCFFCPAMRPTEIQALGETYPDLLERAIQMEKNAEPNLTSVVGLGRSFRWQDVVKQKDLFGYEKYAELTARCGCYDG